MNPRPLGPEPSALPNCATPRCCLFFICFGRSRDLLIPRRSPRSFARIALFAAMLAPALGCSSSQKSRSAAIFGSPIYARYQTALHLDGFSQFSVYAPHRTDKQTAESLLYLGSLFIIANEKIFVNDKRRTKYNSENSKTQHLFTSGGASRRRACEQGKPTKRTGLRPWAYTTRCT